MRSWPSVRLKRGMMKNKRKRKLAKTQEKCNEQLRRMNKIIDDYLWNKQDAKESMRKLVGVVYETK